jgi:hypothetical protein
MADEPPLRLDDEQRQRVRDCLRKDGFSLPSDRFERFIGDIEALITDYLAAQTSQGADALRRLSLLCVDPDPPIWMVRTLIERVAAEHLDVRFPIAISSPFVDDGREAEFQNWAQFSEWARTAKAAPLIFAARVITAAGARIVEGRSRGGGKRSARRVEPIPIGEARGAGRPKNDAQQDLVLYLAIDWHHATGKMPTAGRSDYLGFGDLVHSVFQWLELPEGSAAYALRGYWAQARKGRERKPGDNP